MTTRISKTFVGETCMKRRKLYWASDALRRKDLCLYSICAIFFKMSAKNWILCEFPKKALTLSKEVFNVGYIGTVKFREL